MNLGFRVVILIAWSDLKPFWQMCYYTREFQHYCLRLYKHFASTKTKGKTNRNESCTACGQKTCKIPIGRLLEISKQSITSILLFTKLHNWNEEILLYNFFKSDSSSTVRLGNNWYETDTINTMTRHPTSPKFTLFSSLSFDVVLYIVLMKFY